MYPARARWCGRVRVKPIGVGRLPCWLRPALRRIFGDSSIFDAARVANLSDGASTQWTSFFAEDGNIQVLGDGVFLAAHRAQESLDLYHITAPDKSQLLGSPPRPLLGVSVSSDLERAAAFDRDYHADAWMYNVVRQ